MKKIFITIDLVLIFFTLTWAQQKATVREYTKVFKTYPFSDPDPIPEVGKIYPYFRYDGYTDTPIQKEWKVVELENDYIKVMILPEIGGKIWAAIEKSTGKSFIYYNHVVKFRDVAMRGPWTSGGIEANYGIIGHTPNCATPVDYSVINKSDGSVSCVIGVLDLLTRTNWRLDINLPKDKAYFTTSSFWYNASPIEQPYYTWMNTGIKASGNLEFIYPGTRYLGHEGEYSSWPFNSDNGRNISFYDNNNFGGYKSYHVFGEYTDFFGGYWHDEDFGMGRYAPHDEKAGKKIWIWGLSEQGMIWEKLLTDTDGQYVEVQSGRLFNQAAPNSTFTPFKHKGFFPHATDIWKEYWFPVIKTKGFVAANNFGVLNIKPENGWLKIYFSPLQSVQDELKITIGNKTVYSKALQLNTLELFADSISLDTNEDQIVATLGENKLVYNAAPSANILSRPVQFPNDFDWNSVYGLYVQGKENIRQRQYVSAEENLRACLQLNPNYLPALTDFSMLLYKSMNYTEALEAALKALSIDTYDPAANYYYGLINSKLGKITDAKDGFDLASLGLEYRSASYIALSRLYLIQSDFQKSIEYARKSIAFNPYAVDAYQLLAVIYRLQQNRLEAAKVVNSLLSFDPLNHFAQFENYLWENSDENKKSFMGQIRSDLPQETFLELAVWYYNIGRNNESVNVLRLSPPCAETAYWLAFLENKPIDVTQLNPDFVFPFRPETAEILEQLIKNNDYWLLKFHLGLILWNFHNLDLAKNLFIQCGNQPDYAPFYASKAELFKQEEKNGAVNILENLQKAATLDKTQWRYGKNLIAFYLSDKQLENADSIAAQYFHQFPDNYILGLLYAKTLLQNRQYAKASNLLKTIQVLPNEGATEGRHLYKETHLMLALNEMGKKNYKKALNYIAKAKKWPENLGVGRPYDSDIDERLENWLTYYCYEKMGNKTEAQFILNKILLSNKQKNESGNILSSANNLVTAWAMQKTGKSEQAEKFLKEWLGNDQDNPFAVWVSDAYYGKYIEIPDETKPDENYRVLKNFIKQSL